MHPYQRLEKLVVAPRKEVTFRLKPQQTYLSSVREGQEACCGSPVRDDMTAALPIIGYFSRPLEKKQVFQSPKYFNTR